MILLFCHKLILFFKFVHNVMCNLGFSLIFSKEIILELKKIIYYCLKNEMDKLNP